MPIILYNLVWMSFNVVLAIIPSVLGYLIYKVRNKGGEGVLFPLWLFFFPNTLYLLTDLIHLKDDLRAESLGYALVVVIMYLSLVVIGLMTYVLALYPVVKTLERYSAGFSVIGLVVINFLTGIGLILGRYFRFNSWDVLLRPQILIDTVYMILTTSHYQLLCIIFTILSTVFYLVVSTRMEMLMGKKKKK
ncbi:DUF1361 domain-containing protein [soil metagenome]